MRILINLFHPDLQQSKVNAGWKKFIEKSDNITLNLPYVHYPDWNIDIEREQRLLTEHDIIVFQFPFLWYSTPPLMKKWQDDVLTYGWAYGSDATALINKKVMFAISAGCSENSYQAGGDNLYSITELLRPLQQTMVLTGMHYHSPFILFETANISDEKIKHSAQCYLTEVLSLIQK